MGILFLHGYGSDPNGIRPTFLQQRGYDVAHPALPDGDFERSVQIAREAFVESRPDVVVGSSRGGAVAMRLDPDAAPLVLIAPAWRSFGGPATVGRRTIILHSAADDVVPIAGSRELVRRSGLSEDHLVVVGENHRMVDAAAFEALVAAIERVAATPPGDGS